MEMHKHVAHFAQHFYTELIWAATLESRQPSTMLLFDYVYNQKGALNKISHQWMLEMAGCGCLCD